MIFSKKSKYRERWIGQERRIDCIIEALKKQEDWTLYLVNCEENPFGELPHIDKKSPSYDINRRAQRDLRGITLSNLDFKSSQGLSDALLDYSNLKFVNFSNSTINNTSFSESRLENVFFDNCKMTHTNFKDSKLKNVSFAGAKLKHTCFFDSILSECTFSSSEVENAEINREPIYGNILRLFGFRKGTRIKNSSLHISTSSTLFDLFLSEQVRIDKIISSGLVFASFYYFLSDYGRSFRRLGIMLAIVWLIFGSIYSGLPQSFLPSNSYNGLLLKEYLTPELYWENNSDKPESWFSPYYFSVATSFTLTFGDIRPKSKSAKIIICLEVLLSALFFGLFISMIANYEEKFK